MLTEDDLARVRAVVREELGAAERERQARRRARTVVSPLDGLEELLRTTVPRRRFDGRRYVTQEDVLVGLGLVEDGAAMAQRNYWARPLAVALAALGWTAGDRIKCEGARVVPYYAPEPAEVRVSAGATFQGTNGGAVPQSEDGRRFWRAEG